MNIHLATCQDVTSPLKMFISKGPTQKCCQNSSTTRVIFPARLFTQLPALSVSSLFVVTLCSPALTHSSPPGLAQQKEVGIVYFAGPFTHALPGPLSLCVAMQLPLTPTSDGCHNTEFLRISTSHYSELKCNKFTTRVAAFQNMVDIN